MGFDKCVMPCVHCDSVLQNSFTDTLAFNKNKYNFLERVLENVVSNLRM